MNDPVIRDEDFPFRWEQYRLPSEPGLIEFGFWIRVPHGNKSISVRHFRRHIGDHYASPQEPWDELLPEKIDSLCKKQLPLSVEELAEVYLTIVGILDRGIRMSEDDPWYIKYKREVRPYTSTRVRHETCFLFVAPEAYIIIAANNMVATSYFVATAANTRDEPRDTMNWRSEAIGHVIRKYVDNRVWHLDNKNKRKWRVVGRVEMHSPENWQNARLSGQPPV